MDSLYQTLANERYEVRMLAFAPNPTSTRVECTMKTCSLVYNPPRYVAVSYCWGDENDRREIVVNSQVVSVTVSLEQALRRVRQYAEPGKLVWADAMCINQRDNQERNLQVRFMTRIYSGADTVYAWLGKGIANGASGIQAIHELLQSGSVPQARVAGQTLLDAISELRAIFCCPLWRRRWIIQELTVASAIQLLFHDSQLSWDDLATAYGKCRLSATHSSEHDTSVSPYRQISELRQKYWQGNSLNLCDAIVSTRNYLSKDPRDSIYALLGITSDGTALVPTPNYFQDVDQVMYQLTRAVLSRNANLDIILASKGSRIQPSNLPSWSPNWCSPEISNTVSATATTPLLHPALAAELRLQSHSPILNARGVKIGTMAILSSSLDLRLPLQQSNEYSGETIEDACKKYYGSRISIANALIATLLSSYVPHHTSSVDNFQMWFYTTCARRCPALTTFIGSSRYTDWIRANQGFLLGRVCFYQYFSLRRFFIALAIWAFVLAAFATAIGIMDRRLSDQKDSRPSTLVNAFIVLSLIEVFLVIPVLYLLVETTVHFFTTRRFTDRLQQARRMFVLDEGVIGSATDDSQPGDCVCLLVGCTQAVILRPQGNDNLQRYTIIGEAKVTFNNRERLKYQAFIGYRPDLKRTKRRLVFRKWRVFLHTETSTHEKVLEDYRLLEIGQSFALV